jgi:hypothetical protein
LAARPLGNLPGQMSAQTDEVAESNGGRHSDPAVLHALRERLQAARRRHGAPTAPRAPSGPQLARPAERRSGPNPWLLAGGAFALGVLAARTIAWRAHAHPRG